MFQAVYNWWYHEQAKIDQLIYDVCCGNLDEVKRHLQNNTDLNGGNRDIENILECAVDRSNVEMADLLIKYGADVNSQSFEGRPLLCSVIRLKNLRMLQLFLDNNANVFEAAELVSRNNYPIFRIIFEYQYNIEIFNQLIKHADQKTLKIYRGTELLLIMDCYYKYVHKYSLLEKYAAVLTDMGCLIPPNRPWLTRILKQRRLITILSLKPHLSNKIGKDPFNMILALLRR
jgi:hypothetical protein